MQPCRNPRGTTTLPLFKEGVPGGGGSFSASRDYLLSALTSLNQLSLAVRLK